MTAEDPKYAQVIEKIVPRSRLLRTWPLAGGISAEMTALEIQDPDGTTQKLIVRRPGAGSLNQNPLAAETEFKMLQIAQSLGLPAPVALALDISGAIFSTPYLVTGYVEGQIEFAPAHAGDYAAQMAARLAQIHSTAGAHADLSTLPRQPGDLSGLIGPCPTKMHSLFDEGRIRDMLERAWPNRRPNPPTLLHGDYWPGNILWQGDRLAAVIDWEDACTGDPLSDLAISRLDMLWIIGQDAMHTFTHEYLSRTALDTSGLPVWDLCAVLRLARLAGDDLAGWAAFFHPYGRHDITENSIREHCRYFVSQACERLSKG